MNDPTLDWHYIPRPKKEKEDDCFIEPANMGNVFWRLPELITDPWCNELSASRWGLFWMNIVVMMFAAVSVIWGRDVIVIAAMDLVKIVAGIDAGIYFASTVKDWRWRRRDKDNDGNQ